MEQPKDQKKSLLKTAFITIIAASSFGVVSYYLHLDDYIESAMYQPTAEMQTLLDNVNFTNAGNRIMRAADPSLESREDFNNNCTARGEKSYVLGCYITTTDKIHLYNIELTDETSNLRGVVESTTAHEMLHAVWNRMAFWERTSVSEELQKVYNSADDSFKKEFDLYNSEEFYDELHSRAAVELKTLPEPLEKHYAKYFANRGKIVDYYKNYSSVFKKLEAEADKLAVKIKAESASIDKDTDKYYEQTKILDKEIAEFNKCADTTDCFTSNTEFNNRRADLQGRIDQSNADYENLNRRIAAYNEMVEQYNGLVVKSNMYSDTINSKSVEQKVEANVNN